MPCYRCGARQVDPDRGESPWKRGVRADRQVLICPACQSSVDWSAELDRCPVCSSMHLVRRLGEVECRDCGDVREPGAAPASVTPIAGAAPGGAAGSAGGSSVGGDADFGETPGLAEEVELALARVLGRGKPARIG
ncbi:MAG: hypothetical protein WB800_33845 [Streptosporangiaceae bacterium]